MGVRVFFAWYDFWMGCYWDRTARVLYVCLLPCIVLQFGQTPEKRMDAEISAMLNRQVRCDSCHGELFEHEMSGFPEDPIRICRMCVEYPRKES